MDKILIIILSIPLFVAFFEFFAQHPVVLIGIGLVGFLLNWLLKSAKRIMPGYAWAFVLLLILGTLVKMGVITP